MRIFIMGNHANRTPLSYAPYKSLFQSRFTYVDSADDADVIVFGYVLNIDENTAELARLRAKNPGLRLVVISEEPLWDTTNSGDFRKRHNMRVTGGQELPYSVINHHTSDAYAFRNFPYFLTTSDDFYLRYSRYFAQNAALAAPALLATWKAAPIRAAFFAEHRDLAKKYNISHPEIETWGLSVYRTKLAEQMPATTMRVGQGWDTATTRQTLPDWHLDKIATLRGASFIVSAIENTSQTHYVSEKIFDAFACRAVPLYWAPASHAVNRLVPQGAFLNLQGLEPATAAERILAFTPNLAFAETYAAAQQRLADLFRSQDAFLAERFGFFERISAELTAIVEERQG